MNTETVYFQYEDFGNLVVQIDGLSTFMRYLKHAESKLGDSIMEGLEKAASPVLSTARANASSIADAGTFADSLSIVKRKAKAQILLQSKDPAARVKEFARFGATTITSKGTKLADTRLAMKSGVGVPRRANPPRVMIPAVDDNHELVKSRIDQELARLLEGFNG